MKKLLFTLFLFATAQMSYCQNTAISFTPLTRIEWVNGEPKLTTPIDLKLTQLYQIGQSSFYYGAGIGFGLNTNLGTDDKIHGEVPLMALAGGEVIKGFAAISIGAGVNLINGNPIIGFGINAYTFPIKIGANERREKTIPALIGNDDYKRSKIGFNKE